MIRSEHRPGLPGIVALALLVSLSPAPGAARALVEPGRPAAPAPAAPPARAEPAGDRGVDPSWKARLDRLLEGKPAGVAVRIDGVQVYGWAARARRVPASNQKLLAAMALLEELGPELDLPTRALGPAVVDGVVPGDLWIAGKGDPSLASSGAYDRALPFDATRLGALADAIAAAGVERIEGRVLGAISYFDHDWSAPGWRSYFPARYVALPSALTIDGNQRDGKHIDDPELRLARKLTDKLRARGIAVPHKASAGVPPAGLSEIARLPSPPLEAMLRYTNRWSSNFFAEVFGKRLAVATGTVPGTIAGGAAAIEDFAARRGVTLEAYDSSGLSYSNRVSPKGLALLIDLAEEEPWGPLLRRTLPKGDQGTLDDRFEKVRVRAKTGTLDGISALSGWVWLRQRKAWASFSIMSSMPKAEAVELEDAIVRLLANRAG